MNRSQPATQRPERGECLLNARGRKHLPAWDEKAMEIDRADVAELVDARDLKSLDGNVVWVRVPPPAPKKLLIKSRLCDLEARVPTLNRPKMSKSDQARKRRALFGLFASSADIVPENPDYEKSLEKFKHLDSNPAFKLAVKKQAQRASYLNAAFQINGPSLYADVYL